MGAINTILQTAIDAIEEVGKKDSYWNDGYHFKADTTTRSVDDITIKADGDEFVLACVWKNLPDYRPSLPNLKHAFDKYGLVVNDKEELGSLIKDLLIEVTTHSPNSNELCKRANKLLDRLV